ncbi:LysR substrate-binding domain-containing protein [Erythrobacter sp.]|uniref:LysR substrate-binding domain-containing protein n=1 Tax=Erythrobacter sp. TaxID=1042 RepID=UPI00311E7B15
MLTNLDMAVLRTLVTAVDAGSFTRAASVVGRSQSAVSLQIDKLERQVGKPLFAGRRGRTGDGGLQLTEAGQVVLTYARRILELNDEAVDAVRGFNAQGAIRIGIAEDLAETWLPVVLARFARTRPDIRIETTVGRSNGMLDQLDRGEQDIALVFSVPRANPVQGECHWRIALPIIWIGPPGWRVRRSQPVPLVTFEPPCLFRGAAQTAIDGAGMESRIVFQSPSLAGLWSAISAGLGITTRTPLVMPTGLVQLKPRSSGLPPLPRVEFAMYIANKAERRLASDVAAILSDILEASIRSAAM